MPLTNASAHCRRWWSGSTATATGEQFAEGGQVGLRVADQGGVDPGHVRRADTDAVVGQLQRSTLASISMAAFDAVVRRQPGAAVKAASDETIST